MWELRCEWRPVTTPLIMNDGVGQRRQIEVAVLVTLDGVAGPEALAGALRIGAEAWPEVRAILAASPRAMIVQAPPAPETEARRAPPHPLE